MSDLSPQEVESLILGYEELDLADRAVADTYLSRHPELVARLQWHQQKEGQAVEKLPVQDLFAQENVLRPSDEDAQQESLRQILAGLDLGAESGEQPERTTVKTVSFSQHFQKYARWVLPLAAVLAVVVLLPRGVDKSLLLRDLVVTQVELAPDGSRGAEFPVTDDGVLHSGQAFALDFYLNEDAFVVVYHIDPSGQVARVYPESLAGDLSRHRGGQGHQIPSPDSGETWILGTETGTESFLVSSGQNVSPDLDHIRVADGIIDRAEILANVKAQLEGLMDQVDLYEFEHID